MPEARDRLPRPVDIAALYAQRRSLHLGTYQDNPELNVVLFGSPNPRTTTRAGTATDAGSFRGGRGGLGTPVGRGQGLPRTPGVLEREITRTGTIRRERRRGRGGSRNGLPSWYPRRPLQDITPIVRAIERRRERLGGEDNGQEIGTPMPPVRRVSVTSEVTPSTSAYLEHSVTPLPSRSVKPAHSAKRSVPEILLDITSKASGDSEFITPQKKLLNSIDTVQKDVMEELRRLKRTPSAKKAEREKRVRTLMSMR